MPIYKLLTDYIYVNDAQKQEIYYILEYKKNGWNLLNTSNGGEIGCGKKIITFDMCKNAALKFKTIKDFRKNANKFYNSAIRNHYMDQICGHMIKKRILWTKEMCFEVSKNYNSISDFKKNLASSASMRLGVYDEVMKNMSRIREPNNTLNYEYCKKISLEFKSRRELYLNNPSVYKKCIILNCLEEFFPNNKFKQNGYWNIENCSIESKKYLNRSSFKKQSGSAYQSALKNGWLNEICKHML